MTKIKGLYVARCVLSDKYTSRGKLFTLKQKGEKERSGKSVFRKVHSAVILQIKQKAKQKSN